MSKKSHLDRIIAALTEMSEDSTLTPAQRGEVESLLRQALKLKEELRQP